MVCCKSKLNVLTIIKSHKTINCFLLWCSCGVVSYMNNDGRQWKNIGIIGPCDWILSRGRRSGASYQRWVCSMFIFIVCDIIAKYCVPCGSWSMRMVPIQFQARLHTRRPNPALALLCLFLCYTYLSVYWCMPGLVTLHFSTMLSAWRGRMSLKLPILVWNDLFL